MKVGVILKSIAEFYGLSYLPFQKSPRSVPKRYISADLQQGLGVAKLTAAEGGIGLLTGPFGTGVSYTAYCTYCDLDRSIHDVRYYCVCHVTPRDFYKGICRETGTSCREKGRDAMIAAIRERAGVIRDQGRMLYLILDNAQNIPQIVLDDLLVLVNDDYNVSSRMCILLCGTNELRNSIRFSATQHVMQAMTNRYAFRGLSKQECADYVIQSLKAAGGTEQLVSQDVLPVLHDVSARGNIGILNNLMCTALRVGRQSNKQVIDMEVIQSAAAHME